MTSHLPKVQHYGLSPFWLRRTA